MKKNHRTQDRIADMVEHCVEVIQIARHYAGRRAVLEDAIKGLQNRSYKEGYVDAWDDAYAAGIDDEKRRKK